MAAISALEALKKPSRRGAAHQFHLPARRHHQVDSRLAAQRLEDGRQEAGEECRAVAAAAGGASAPHESTGAGSRATASTPRTIAPTSWRAKAWRRSRTRQGAGRADIAAYRGADHDGFSEQRSRGCGSDAAAGPRRRRGHGKPVHGPDGRSAGGARRAHAAVRVRLHGRAARRRQAHARRRKRRRWRASISAAVACGVAEIAAEAKLAHRRQVHGRTRGELRCR